MKRKITLLYDKSNWIEPVVFGLMIDWKDVYDVELACTTDALKGGDVCFYFNVPQIIGPSIRGLYKHNVVIHAGDLPKDRGWSPYIWAILRGENAFPVTLCEAEEKVDSGLVYHKEWVNLEGHEVLIEIQHKVSDAARKACKLFMEQYPDVHGVPQTGEPTYNRRRTPDDSKLDLDKTLAEQFNLLRAVDNVRYPAWFTHNGYKYIVRMTKAGRDDSI